MTDGKATRAALDEIARTSGTLDILVNNAGLRDRRPFAQLDAPALRTMLESHLVAPFELCRAALPRGFYVFSPEMPR